MFKDPNRTGDWAELKACTWLFEQGYEVFRNIGCTGDIDLVAIRDREVIKIDVKTLKETKDGQMLFRAQDHEATLAKGIRFLWVRKDGVVGWNRDYF